MEQDFSELIQYLDEKFTGIDQDFKELKTGFDNLQSSVDAYSKKADTYFQEMVMVSHRMDRHEKWFQQIAEKIGMKLEY